jgi:uncharacterized delta-60 repeat protein
LKSEHGSTRTLGCRTVILGALLLTAAVGLPAWAAGRALDPTFGTDGKVLTNFTPQVDAASSVAAQADGRLVAGGSAGIGSPDTKFALARYDSDGVLDSTFGGDGRVTTDFTKKWDVAPAVAIQPDGKVVATGVAGFRPFPPIDLNSQIALARYRTDGSLDPSFGEDGKVTTDLTPTLDGANAIALQPDGKIVVAGGADAAGATPLLLVARYNSDGTLDATFGSNGSVTTRIRHGAQAFGVAVQADGRIVVSGESFLSRSNTAFAIARYNADGSLDDSFGGNGKVTTDFTPGFDGNNAVAIQADGKIVASGGAGNRPTFAVARYNSDGSLDSTFGGDGKVRTAFSNKGDFAEEGLAIQSDGKIVAGGVAAANGANARFAIARYNPDGTLDTTSGGDGRVSTDVTPQGDDAIGLVIQADGKIVAAGIGGEVGEGGGNAKFALVRYLTP